MTREWIPGALIDVTLVSLPLALLAPIPWLACYGVYRRHGFSGEQSLALSDSDASYPFVTCMLAVIACLIVARAAREASKNVRWLLEAGTALLSVIPAFACWTAHASGGLGPVGADDRMYPLLLLAIFALSGWFSVCAACSPRRYRAV